MPRDRLRRALPWILALVCLACPARATDVKAACPALSAETSDELVARVRLTLQAAAESARPRSILIACNERDTWVIWDGPPAELLPVAVRRERTEGALSVIEARLAAETEPEPEPELPPPERRRAPPLRNLDGPGPTPSFAPPTPPVESEPRRALRLTHGGIALGLSAELLGAPLSAGVGPRLDVGVGWGPFSLLLVEAVRVGGGRGGELSTFGFDAGLGAGWGAPFDTRYPVGAALLGGVDWLSVHTSGAEQASRTRTSGLLNAGARAALYAADFAFWLGVDGRYRFAPQTYGAPIDVELPHMTAMITLSVALVVDVSRRTP